MRGKHGEVVQRCRNGGGSDTCGRMDAAAQDRCNIDGRLPPQTYGDLLGLILLVARIIVDNSVRTWLLRVRSGC